MEKEVICYFTDDKKAKVYTLSKSKGCFWVSEGFNADGSVNKAIIQERSLTHVLSILGKLNFTEIDKYGNMIAPIRSWQQVYLS